MNVGLPKDVGWQGKTVFTGVFKDPVTGPRRVASSTSMATGRAISPGMAESSVPSSSTSSTPTGIGNRSSDETTSSTDSLARTSRSRGSADDEVCIGDRYQIGSAMFEVTQPRVTCYRVGIRMNDPRIPALLVSHHRPGFYFRVLHEGEVEAGEEIVKLVTGPEEMTVAEVSALLYLPGHPRQQLLRALRIPALSAGWQGSFRALLDGEGERGNAGLATASPPAAWPGFRRLAVTAINQESDSVISIRFEDPDGKPLPAARAGQYLTLRIKPEGADRPLLRNYSLSGPPDAGYYRIAVKRERDGAASTYLHTRLAVADQLEVAAPRGSFILDESEAPVLLISAGIGSTPVLAMLNALAEKHSAREIWWLHGARSGHEHSFAAETRTLLAAFPNARIRVFYSRPGADDLKGRDFDIAGRLTPSLILEHEPPRDAEAYICGPARFMDEISAGLASIGIDASHIHTEPFGPEPSSTPGIASTPARTPHLPVGSPGGGPTIEFARSNLEVSWSSDYGSLLELAEACDVPVRWSCRTGVCQTCETTLIAGELDYNPDPVEPPPDGSALICCSQPHDDVVLDL